MKSKDRKHLIRAMLVGALVTASAVAQAANPSSAGTGKRPNIVIILGDDLGFSDMGCFGSEIKTPHLGVGFTLGYQITDNLSLTAGYMATVNDNAPTDLRMDGFRISLTYGWHKIVEGQKRLKSED